MHGVRCTKYFKFLQNLWFYMGYKVPIIKVQVLNKINLETKLIYYLIIS